MLKKYSLLTWNSNSTGRSVVYLTTVCQGAFSFVKPPGSI